MTKINKSHLDGKESTMPVIFSEKKRREISDQIKEAALRLFETKGIRKTTVAELAESVGIAKGTFYNFYATKGQLVAEIMDDFNDAAEQELRKKLEGRPKIPVTEFYNYYTELFRPNTAFSFHFGADDIMLMQEMEETKKFFSAEYAVKNAKLVMGFLDGIREDIDYGYIANFAKLVNLAIENRSAFCEDAFERNLQAIFGLMLQYLCGNEDKERNG